MFAPKAQDRLRQAPAARAAPAGADLVLLHLERGTYFTLNATGAWIWHRLDGEATLGEICAAMVERFDVDPASAWADLVELIAELEADALVVPAD